MSYFLPKGDYVMMYVILCISIHMMLIVLFVCFPGTLLQKLFNIKYDGTAGVRDYVLRMVDLKTKLQALNVSIPDACIVHQALNTLPPDFGIIKTNYNSQDETWSINDLIARVVAEEEKLKKEKGHMALYVSSSHKRKNKKSRNRTHKGTHDTTGQSDNMGPKKTSFKRDGDRCFFCKKKGHIKKDCAKFKAWLSKREPTGIHKSKESKSR